MERMKSLLGAGEQPTIGDGRRQGITQFIVRCPPPCNRIAAVKFDALGLPDTTVLHDIPKLKRLRCTDCGHVATEIEMTWAEQVAYGNGRRPLTGWRVIARAPDGDDLHSDLQSSLERALGLANDLADVGDEIVWIEGPTGNITAEEFAAQRRARRP